jgi:hypothetical protein
MEISVEYLAIFRRTDTFCDTDRSFTRLLQVDSNIVVGDGVVRFQGQPTCNFKIVAGEVAAKKQKQRYFQLRFTWDGDPVAAPEDLERFNSLLKAVRGAIAQAGGEAHTLWNDVSGYYARAAYPLIHEIENLMRRLIANFMLVNVGSEWPSETLPSGVEEAVRKSKRKDDGEDGAAKGKGRNYLNVLHELDFIHLGDILFDAYSKKTPLDLYARLKDVKTSEDVGALQDFIPQSNWKRYFQKLVDCDDSYLESRWKKLYVLRCKVAHNAILTGHDLVELSKLIDEVKPKLLDAVGKLSNVTVPPDEVELVAESAARTVNAAVDEFIALWQQLESAVARLVPSSDGRPRPGELLRMGILNNWQADRYDFLRRIRNQLVHGPASDVPVESIQRAAEELRAMLTEVGHRTRRGELVRSKSEVIVADLLADLKVEYVYLKELVIDGIRQFPNFTIEDAETGTTFYWEHCGVLHNPDYRALWESKLQWYRKNGILPYQEGGGSQGTLIVTRDTEQGGISSQEIESLIRKVILGEAE